MNELQDVELSFLEGLFSKDWKASSGDIPFMNCVVWVEGTLRLVHWACCVKLVEMLIASCTLVVKS